MLSQSLYLGTGGSHATSANLLLKSSNRQHALMALDKPLPLCPTQTTFRCPANPSISDSLLGSLLLRLALPIVSKNLVRQVHSIGTPHDGNNGHSKQSRLLGGTIIAGHGMCTGWFVLRSRPGSHRSGLTVDDSVAVSLQVRQVMSDEVLLNCTRAI